MCGVVWCACRGETRCSVVCSGQTVAGEAAGTGIPSWTLNIKDWVHCKRVYPSVWLEREPALTDRRVQRILS